MITRKTLTALSVMATLAAAPASAATVVFQNITGTWFNGTLTDGNPITMFSNNGTANASVRWGVEISPGAGQSGYDFEAIGIPSLTVNPPGGSAQTSIAKFRHVNIAIFPPSAADIKLNFAADVSVDGGAFSSVNFIYSFKHTETTNNLDPCPFGGANGQGVNVNGCADNVAVNFAGTSDFFLIGTDKYTLDIEGFLANGNVVTSFNTVEGMTNEAEILGSLKLIGSAVPEPASWALMIGGFGLVGATARRRRIAVVAA